MRRCWGRPMPRPSHPKRSNPVVRVADFNRVLQKFNLNQGAKVALTIHKYHQEHIEPRLAALEWYATPFYRKVWIYLGRFGFWLWSWFPRLRRLSVGEQVTVPNPDGSPTSDVPLDKARVTEIAPDSITVEDVEPAPPSIRDAEGHLITPESDQVAE